MKPEVSGEDLIERLVLLARQQPSAVPLRERQFLDQLPERLQARSARRQRRKQTLWAAGAATVCTSLVLAALRQHGPGRHHRMDFEPCAEAARLKVA